MIESKQVVLLHGHGVNSSLWDDVYSALSADFQLIRPDFSTRTTHQTIEAYAEDLYSMVQSGQFKKVILVGHSMGGYIVLAFAERYPELVSGLVLFHSTVFADDEARKPKRQAAIEQLQQQGSAAFASEAVPNMFAESNKTQLADLVQQRVEAAGKLPADALIAGVRAIAGRLDRSSVLRDAPYPVLVIAGEEDKLVPFDKSKEMAALLNEKGQFVAMEGVGHLGMIEKPDESIALLREFLTKV